MSTFQHAGADSRARAHEDSDVRGTVTESPPEGGGHSPASGPLLSVDHVRICYRMRREVVTAVGDACFEMRHHERLILIGPSGCGKSTLLKAIGGFLEPDAGSIRFEGRADLTPGPDRAVVFQEFDQLFPWKTVLENVAYPLRVTGRDRSEARDRALEFLEMTGLGPAAKRHPHELSGGMKQRAAIARALALEPKMLLMDEPFGSLDAITRARLQRELKRIAERTRVAVFFVTHSIQEALLLADRIVVLSPPPSTVLEVVDVRDIDGPSDPGYLETQARLHKMLGATDEERADVQD